MHLVVEEQDSICLLESDIMIIFKAHDISCANIMPFRIWNNDEKEEEENSDKGYCKAFCIKRKRKN